jgi:hypothetical protein
VAPVSGQGRAVQDFTSLLDVSSGYVRDVMHAYNEWGFDALEPQWNGGDRRRSMRRSANGSA